MKKIFTSGSFIWNEQQQCYVHDDASAEFYFSNEPIAQCKGGGGGGGNSTTIQKSEPWADQQKYLNFGYYNALNRILDAPAQTYYPGETVAPFSPETETALSMQTDRAINGSPLNAAANKNILDTLNGSYLYGGDAFNAALDAATRRIMPQVNSAFETAGRGGSGLALTAQTQALGDAFAGQYGQERQNQMMASQLAPTLANQDYFDIGKLAEVGAARENLEQQKIQEAIDRHNFAYNANITPVERYMALINGGGIANTSTSSSNSQTPGRSPIGGAIGAAGQGLLGYGMSAAMGMNPVLGAAGGILGGLGGFL